MRFHQFSEARRNPEMSKQTRLPIMRQASNYIRKQPPQIIKNMGVRFSGGAMMTINTRFDHVGPTGLYFFPADYYLTKQSRKEAKHYINNEFGNIHVFTYDPTNVLVLNTITAQDVEQAIAWVNPKDEKEFRTKLARRVGPSPKAGNMFLEVFRLQAILIRIERGQLSLGDPGDATLCNKLLRSYGNYTALIDYGEGIIHGSEPTQGVILDPRIVKHTELFSQTRS